MLRFCCSCHRGHCDVSRYYVTSAPNEPRHCAVTKTLWQFINTAELN